MQINIPDSWAVKFARFDEAEAYLRGQWQSEGVSAHGITRCFASCVAVDGVWRDPAFKVWTALRGIGTASDFFDRWADAGPSAPEGKGDEADRRAG